MISTELLLICRLLFSKAMPANTTALNKLFSCIKILSKEGGLLKKVHNRRPRKRLLPSNQLPDDKHSQLYLRSHESNSFYADFMAFFSMSPSLQCNVRVK